VVWEVVINTQEEIDAYIFRVGKDECYIFFNIRFQFSIIQGATPQRDNDLEL
jgi:hypothetical protein